MRLATIKVPLKSKDAELTVTVLERQAGNDTEYLLQNINRWREQMSQGAIGDPDLERLEKIDANGSAAYIISVAGKQKAGGMAGPMMGGRG
jgi:hypothetical protein